MTTKRSNRTTNSIQTSDSNQNIVTGYRWGWYALAMFVPFAGILTGLFLYDQDSREVRKVGRNCLFIGFLVWVVFPVIIMIVVAAFLALAAASWLADMMPAGGD